MINRVKNIVGNNLGIIRNELRLTEGKRQLSNLWLEIKDLDEDERNNLYQIIRLAKLEDKIQVPEPCDVDKDRNDFEKMKGEIIAGNDNVENIKKFKLLTLKLKNQSRLPYREANNILVDLATLGY